MIWDAVLDHFRFAGEVARTFSSFSLDQSHGGHAEIHGNDLGRVLGHGRGIYVQSLHGHFCWLDRLDSCGLRQVERVYRLSGPTFFPDMTCFLALFSWGYVEGHLALFEILSLIAFLEFWR